MLELQTGMMSEMKGLESDPPSAVGMWDYGTSIGVEYKQSSFQQECLAEW